MPPGVQINVPRPSNNHPEWTSDPYTGVDIPPTFDDLVELPDYQTEPVLYAAAVDTIRMTNTYFELTGSYDSERSKRYPLTKDLVLEKTETWLSTVDENGNKKELSPEEGYAGPPDPRTLFVKEKMGDPTDEKLRPLWTKACGDVKRMSDYNWERYLGYTRQQLINQAKSRLDKDEEWLIVEIFKRYLVWNELVEGQRVSKRARNLVEEQPTWVQMEEFFTREDVKEEGATFVEICHAFPHARDYQMLVHRIQRFATLVPQGFKKTNAGVDDPIESRYMPRPPPSGQGVREAALSLLKRDGSSVSLEELADRYWPFHEHNRLIRDVLDNLTARPDVTTGRFVLPGNEPTREEMEETIKLEQAYYVNGFRLRKFARHFPDRAGDIEIFHQTMSDLVFFDNAEERYFPLYENEETGLKLSPEASLIARDNARIRTSTGLHGNLVWDRNLLGYVLRDHNPHLGEPGGTGAHIIDLGSPTESIPDTLAETPPSEPANAMSKITAWDITPINPRAEPPTPTAPPAEAPPALPVEASTAGPPPLAAEPKNTGRNKKRGPTEKPDESSRKGKKPKKAPKIQCSGRTLQNKRCKKHKEREEGEEVWKCDKHKQN